MSDGQNTQRFISELLDVDCSIDEAIEIEQRLFSNLTSIITHYERANDWNGKQGVSYIDKLEAERDAYRTALELIVKNNFPHSPAAVAIAIAKQALQRAGGEQ